MTKQERAELKRLRSKPPGRRTPDERSRLMLLSVRSMWDRGGRFDPIKAQEKKR